MLAETNNLASYNTVRLQGTTRVTLANPQETPDLVTFTEEILNGKLPFCAVEE